MDTIQISIKPNRERIGELSYSELQTVRGRLNSIKSSYGHYFCECLEISNAGNFIVKISYPRFHAGINAYLISNESECIQVHHEFCTAIYSHEFLNNVKVVGNKKDIPFTFNRLLHDAEIMLNRVDIPFTFLMGEGHKFTSYEKIYQIFSYIYQKKNEKSNPKAYTDIDKFKAETLIYANTPTIAAYNSRIMIYDQYNNIKTKTSDEDKFQEILVKYSDLPSRMRIEVAKRIQRKGFTVAEFSVFNIFREYVKKYKEVILENLFDMDEVENFYKEKSQEIADRLSAYREGTKYFTYRDFIYREIENIYDLEIIRRALKLSIDNGKTREKAITVIREVLRDYELNENIIVMKTKANIKIMRDAIENSFEDSQEIKNKNKSKGNTDVSFNVEDEILF